jgi:hypothetical protein
VWSGSLLCWERELTALKVRLAPVFGRSEIRRPAGAFIDGVLSGITRRPVGKAEQAGLDGPYRMQSLLGRSRWDAVFQFAPVTMDLADFLINVPRIRAGALFLPTAAL